MPQMSIAMKALDDKMQAVKNMYAELLLTMLGALNENAGSDAAPGAISAKVENLAASCADAMRGLAASAGVARANGAMTADMDAQIAQFQDEVQRSLAATHARYARKIASLSGKRDAIKTKLQLIQRKRFGTRGYQKGAAAGPFGHSKPSGGAPGSRKPFSLDA